jgi:hypothetical protein
MFSAGPLAAASQKIAVMHPFSAGEYYEEWLINTEAMIGEFLARGFAVVEKHDSALDFVVNLGTTSPELRRQLTENDQTYADLYGLYILRKGGASK